MPIIKENYGNLPVVGQIDQPIRDLWEPMGICDPPCMKQVDRR